MKDNNINILHYYGLRYKLKEQIEVFLKGYIKKRNNKDKLDYIKTFFKNNVVVLQESSYILNCNKTQLKKIVEEQKTKLTKKINFKRFCFIDTEIIKEVNIIYQYYIQGGDINKYSDFFFHLGININYVYYGKQTDTNIKIHIYNCKNKKNMPFYQIHFFILPFKQYDYPFKYWEKETLLNYIYKNKNKNKRKPINSKLRHEVFLRDNYKCLECGASNKNAVLHIDHIIPFSQGGKDELRNLQTLCQNCNLAKSNRYWEANKLKEKKIT